MLGDFAATFQAATAGDERAFAVIWRAHQVPLVRYLRTMAPELAEDIAGDVWVDVVRNLRSFKGDERSFRAWLFTLARRRMIDAWRLAARTPVLLSADVALEADASRGRAADAADAAMENLETDAALRLIGTLPAEQAEVILLRAVAGLDVKQVARIVGKSPGAVRVAAHRGLRSLAVRVADADVTSATPK